MKMFVDCDRFGTTLWFEDGTMRGIKGDIDEIGNTIKNLTVEQFKNVETGESFKYQFIDIYIDCMDRGYALYDYLQRHNVKVNKITRNKLQLHDNIVIHECSNVDYNYYLRDLKQKPLLRHECYLKSYKEMDNEENFKREYDCKWIGKDFIKDTKDILND